MPDIHELSRDTLVWMVGVAAASQTFARVIQGILDHRLDHAVLYFVTTLLVATLTISIESIKKFLESSNQ